MKNLKRLSTAFALTLLLGMTTFAGETNAPPCAPGETNAPPCSSSQMATGDSASPGETQTPPVSAGRLMAEGALSLLESLLLF